MKRKYIRQLNELNRLSSQMRLAAEQWDKPWKILIATLLSARTRDEVTIPVAEKLFNNYNLEELSKADLKDIQEIIKPINFYKNKSKSIINCAKVLIDKYNGEPPLDIDSLIELSGV